MTKYQDLDNQDLIDLLVSKTRKAITALDELSVEYLMETDDHWGRWDGPLEAHASALAAIVAIGKAAKALTAQR